MRLEAALAAWGHAVYRHPRPVLAAALIVSLALASQLPGIVLDTSTEGFLHEDDPVRVTYDAFREQFGRDERVIVAIEPPEVFDRGFLERLRDFHRDVENEVPRLQDVQSLINARDTRGVGDRLIVGELLEDWPDTPEQLARIRERALANPLYRNLLLDAEGRVTTMMLETDAFSDQGSDAQALAGFDEAAEPGASNGDGRRFLTGEENAEIVAALLNVAGRYQAPDFRIFIAGTPPMVDHLQQSMLRDMGRFTALALLSILAFLGLLFRRLLGVVIPLVVAVLSLVSTLGIMAITGINISLPVQILPSFLLAVGVGASVHVLVIFFQGLRRGATREDAIASALSHSGLAIIMTSLTTAGGLLSFAAAELAPIADFGVAGPAGVMLALFYTIVLVPALCAVFPMREDAAPHSDPGRLLRRAVVGLGEVGTRRAPTVVLATAGLLAIAVLGLLQVRFSHNPILWFHENDFFRVSTEFMNRTLRGTMYLEVLVETGRDNGLHDPALLKRMDEMRRYASSVQRGDVYIGKTVSIVDVVKEINQALNENRSEFYRIPGERQLVAQELLLFENSGSDDLEDVADSRFRVGRFTMKLPFVDAVQYESFIDTVEGRFIEILGDGASVTTTGLMAVMGRTFNAVMWSMAKSYVVALLVITPLMVLLIGNLRIGLLSMVPNLTPIVFTLGLMGWAGVPLDAFTLLIGCIAIGLAVDDTIHFMHNFRRYYERGGDVPQAVRETLETTGQALLFTSLVLATAFFIYMFASLNNLFYFGLLTGFTILTAFLADVLLAPALMTLVVGRPRAEAGPVAGA